MPWWGKIAAKVILSRLPFDYRSFASAGMFRHGGMDRADYALRVVSAHVEQAGLSDLDDRTCLELGPGDAVSSALVAHALGARHTYLVDVGAFASDDMALYRDQAAALRRAGCEVVDIDDCATVDTLLDRVGGVYLTRGLASLRSLPDACIDFCWSQAVLEHIRLAEFDETLRELARLLKPAGVGSHRVDLKDHLAASLNNLRFSRARWEQDWLAASGFYTNRIRHTDMLERFARAGFDAQVAGVDRWAQLPLPPTVLDGEFAELPLEELLVRGFDVVLRHARAASDA